MSRTSRRFLIAGSLIQWLAGVRVFAGDADASLGTALGPVTALMQRERGLIEWHFKGRTLLAYTFATNQLKPYVRELCSLAGENVLRDAPADHPHHHGLMYGIRVNGVNFWEERDRPGHQRHIQLLAHGTSRSVSGLPQAGFTELIHWVPHGEHTLTDTTPVALLIERRTLTLIVDEAKDEVALAWHGEFEVGARTNRVTLHGSDYNGLGLRLPAAWDHVARHQNSENTPYPSGGKPGAVPARWGAVSHTVDGRTTQVALLARPRGHAGTNSFFAMTEPFTYLAATQGLDRAPLEYRAGDRFAIDYLVLVYPAARSTAQIEARYRAWTREFDDKESTNER
jgi:hypothetical protein